MGNDLTRLLRLAADGDGPSKEELYRLIYDDLRSAARRVLRRIDRNACQTTELVNEVLLRFEKPQVFAKLATNRRVFFSVAVRAMEQVMIDQHRRRRRERTLSDGDEIIDLAIAEAEDQIGCEFAALTGALKELEAESPRQHAVITHRFFGGLTIQETADVLQVSDGTVERDWRLARAKLALRLSNEKILR